MNWFGAPGADLEPEVAEEAEEQPGQADRKQRLPPFQGPGQLLRLARRQECEGGGHHREFLAAGEHPQNAHGGQPHPPAANSLNGPEHERQGQLEFAKIVPDQRPEQGRKGHQGRRRDRNRLGSRLRSRQRIGRRDDPPEHDVLDHEQGARIGMDPIEGHQRKPDRRQVIHLPDRRPLLRIGSNRAHRELPIGLGQRPEPLVVIGEVPGPPGAELVVPPQSLHGRHRGECGRQARHEQPGDETMVC